MTMPADPTQAAWRSFSLALDEVRAQVLAEPVSQDAKARAGGLYLATSLGTTAFNYYVAPRQHYPALYQHAIFMPFELQHGLPNPDFVYRFGFLDGARNYRIWSERAGRSAFFALQVMSGWWGDVDPRTVADYELGNYVKADGSLEVFLGPRKRGGDWIELAADSRSNILNIREALTDWENEPATRLHIELIDDGDRDPIQYDELELADRLERAARFVRRAMAETLKSFRSTSERAGGFNRFCLMEPSPERAAIGAVPDQAIAKCNYRLEPGEALVVETRIPTGRYWGVQGGDPWWQASDYLYHQTSLNQHTAHVDGDHVMRMVLCARDPGVQNWIDTVDTRLGQLMFRWNRTDSNPLPSAKVVPFAELRRHLPGGTPDFGPAQRREQLDKRRRFGLARWGF